jgi:hypothetical protein
VGQLDGIGVPERMALRDGDAAWLSQQRCRQQPVRVDRLPHDGNVNLIVEQRAVEVGQPVFADADPHRGVGCAERTEDR